MGENSSLRIVRRLLLGRAVSRAYHAAENLRGAAAMQQVADWLERLGLSQYARCFAENDISFVILPDLTDQDLEKIGVASLGHRRLLLRSIAELKLSIEPRRPATRRCAASSTHSQPRWTWPSAAKSR